MRSLLAFFARRALVAVFLVVAVTAITYVAFFLIPSSPERVLLPEQAPSATRIAWAKHQLGIDRPVTTQYADFVWKLLHGDLGVAWGSLGAGQERVHVGSTLVDAAAVTGSVVLGGAVILFALALPLGVIAAARPRSFVDRTAIAVAIAGISLPPLVVGVLLQTFLGNKWGLAPPSGYCPLIPGHQFADPRFPGEGCAGPVEWARHLVLPWLTFAFFFLAIYMRMLRSRMLDVLNQPYVQTARAKGASELRVLRVHALRNAILPLLAMIGMDVGTAIGVAIYVEVVFGLPGMARLAMSAIGGFASYYDLPLIAGIVVFTTVPIVALNLVVDLLHAAIDPRVRAVRTRGAPAAAAA